MSTRRINPIHAVLYVALFGGLLFGLARQQQSVNDIERESVERRDQNCKIFETEHRREIKRLTDTYRYLVALPDAERGATINRFVLANLPNLEADARLDNAPAYCDKPDVGLPEPDPRIPPRPKSLK